MRARAAWAAAAVLSLPAFLFPIYNPDLFWHLSAGRWIFEHAALPRADWLSFTRPGAPWVDFEWLAQVFFESAFRLGGLTGVWLLKGLLLAAVWLALDAALRARRVLAVERALGLVLWSTAALMHADIRPELFSLALFAAALGAVELVARGRERLTPARWALAAGVFAVWADLHPGFLAAFGLIVCYGLTAALEGRPQAAAECGKLLLAGVVGSLINPYGAGPYRVALSHWRAGAELSRSIAEWHPISAGRPGFWAFWLLLGLTVVFEAAELFRRRADIPWAAMAAAAGLAAISAFVARGANYFAIPAVYIICLGAHRQGAWGRRVLGLAAAVCAIYALWLAPRYDWSRHVNGRFVPHEAAEFAAREQAVVASLRAYNPWEWGGYLGWRLSPWYRVFDDGRYIFHDQLPRQARAVASAGDWQAYLSEQGLNAAWMQNMDMPFQTTKAYPDGATKVFLRPYYLYYMPRERWALAYWDRQALLFVRRDAVPKGWLDAHEYRYVRPRDDAAFADAIARREIPEKAVAAEQARHKTELAEFGDEP